MLPPAPNSLRRGAFSAKTKAVSRTDITASSMAPLFRIFLAPFKSPSPILIDMAGAPPNPTQVPKEERSVTMGPQIPAPASAREPTSGM